MKNYTDYNENQNRYHTLNETKHCCTKLATLIENTNLMNQTAENTN